MKNHELNIADLIIDTSNYEEIIEKIELNIKKNTLFTFHNINMYIINNTFKDKKLKRTLLKIKNLFGDGIGIYWASKILDKKNCFQERITGTDLYYKIIENAEKNKWSIIFYGGAEYTSKNIKQTLLKIYPHLDIKTILSKDNSYLNDEIIEIINKDNSDILMVGLGTPKQEIWLAENCEKIKIPVQFCVGSGIDFLSGNLKRAPLWMRKIGLEWLYRLFQEPRRLWKRYILGIPLFIFYVLRQKVKLVLCKTDK